VGNAEHGMRIADCGLRIADCGLRIADCGLRIDAVFNFHFTSASNKFINPHSAFRIPRSAIRIPSGPGIVIALKISHCVHIVSGLGGGAEPCGWS
jgi:hypothetical protein